MKKSIVFLLLLLLFLPHARSEEAPAFTLDRDFVIPGMAASWNQGYTPTAQDGALSIYLPVRSRTESGRIEATVCVQADMPNPFSGQNMVSSFYKGSDGVWRIALKPKLHKLYVNGDYEIFVRVKGENSETVFPVSFKLRNGRSPEGAMKPLLSDISCDLNVGSEGEIRFTLTNESSYAAFTGVTVEITDPTGEVLPLPSNVHALSSIAPGASIDVCIPASVRSNASVSLHALSFDFSYTALDKPMTFKEIIPLPVTDTIRMEIGEIDLAPEMFAGDIGTISVPVMNLGRSNLANASVKLILSGITDGRTSLIGTIEPGKTGTGKITFTPPGTMEGKAEGKIEISAEDTWGNRQTLTENISVTVKKAREIPASVENSDQGTNAYASFPLYALAALSPVLFLILIIQNFFFKRRIRKLEEDRL